MLEDSSSPVLSVSDLVFEYDTCRALHGISVEVQRGQVVALVGPNGAGKTTFLRCVAALETPFSGRVSVCGFDTQDEPRSCHRCIGYLSDFFGLHNELTVQQALQYSAAIQSVPPSAIASRIEAVVRALRLQQFQRKLIGTLSRGLRQRVAIAQAIIHRPPLVLLDEPAAGLDPESRSDLSTLIRELLDDGFTFVVSSHILAELEDYSTHMMTVRDGRMIGFQAIGESQQSERQLVIQLIEPRSDWIELLQREAAAVVDGENRCLARIAFTGTQAEQAELLARFVREGVGIAELYSRQAKMQDVYLSQMRAKERVRSE